MKFPNSNLKLVIKFSAHHHHLIIINNNNNKLEDEFEEEEFIGLLNDDKNNKFQGEIQTKVKYTPKESQYQKFQSKELSGREYSQKFLSDSLRKLNSLILVVQLIPSHQKHSITNTVRALSIATLCKFVINIILPIKHPNNHFQLITHHLWSIP
jgi:hypothetical protein